MDEPARGVSRARLRSLAPLAFVLGSSLLAGHTLFAPGFYDSHDGLLNVHRLFELEKCLADGQIPCRWVPDMGYGYGYPLFVFYPPFPSYVAEGFRLLGAGLLDAVKWSLLLSGVVAAAAMFALARAFCCSDLVLTPRSASVFVSSRST